MRLSAHGTALPEPRPLNPPAGDLGGVESGFGILNIDRQGGG
jgi:hypothetical protein